ncbi:hypothetical protein [Streptomyces sp. AK02-01A]|uniref:hypothetical protein n=1 Tax=Streptomyces sp. AK02-01A TaxID=3028648 RepID=UPI0029B2B3DF|nr:hypothetical protein [Streptomyces sp. AK02-01A]MDX3855610.1 hypothetical protein [Streptomyces sp. AK02-01A]
MDPNIVTEDLAQAERTWKAAYQALAADTGPVGNTPLRRRLLRLSTLVVRLRRQTGSSAGGRG